MTDELRKLVQAHSKRMDHLQEQIDDLETENEDLHRRIDQLEEVVDPDPANGYDQLTKEQKVRKLRKALLRDALNKEGKAAMKYDEVRALFDMNVSPGHAYNLMEAAASMDGFVYDKSGTQNQGQKRIRVNVDVVNDKTLVQSVNNGSPSLPA